MIIITDTAGYIHIIPRERLVSIDMLPPEPPATQRMPNGQQVTSSGDPPDTKAKLVISYETTTASLGQLAFCFTDSVLATRVQQEIADWASQEVGHHLNINAGQPTEARPPSPHVAAISI